MMDRLEIEKWLIREALDNLEAAWVDVYSCDPEESANIAKVTGYPCDVVELILKGLVAEWSLSQENVPRLSLVAALERRFARTPDVSVTVTESHEVTTNHWRAKLDSEKVTEIRSRLASGESQNRIAKDFNVSQATIHQIAHGDTWRKA